MKIEIINKTELTEHEVFELLAKVYKSKKNRKCIDDERKDGSVYCGSAFYCTIDGKTFVLIIFPKSKNTKIVVKHICEKVTTTAQKRHLRRSDCPSCELKENITLGNPRSDSKDLENLFMDKGKETTNETW